MNQLEKDLLDKLAVGNIDEDYFFSIFPFDIKNDKDYVVSAVEKAIVANGISEIEYAIQLIWLSGKDDEFIDLLHSLLLNPNHYSHQTIVKSLQDLKNPKSVPFIEKALETNFDYIPYNGSDSDSVAKWFSWALASIGTPEALDVIRKYSNSQAQGIREEMLRRLKKIEKS